MDPYRNHNKKIGSPLNKKQAKDSVPSESSAHASVNEKVVDPPTEKTKKQNVRHHTEKESVDETVQEPTFIEHVSELRKQLIKSVVVFLLFFIAAFSTINIWFPYITRGHQLVVLSPMEVISFYTTISAALAFGLAIPFLCHFLWQFVKPGLTEKEGHYLSLYSPFILLLFLAGLAFGYFIVNPLSYNFLVNLGKANFDMMISAKEYGRFLMLTTMPIGLLFELPLVALFLSSIGILTSNSMKNLRKWSYVLLAAVSALITPPDFISQLIILIPMIVLYEVSIFLVTRTEARITSNHVAS